MTDSVKNQNPKEKRHNKREIKRQIRKYQETVNWITDFHMRYKEPYREVEKEMLDDYTAEIDRLKRSIN